jgi:hypothetical protein
LKRKSKMRIVRKRAGLRQGGGGVAVWPRSLMSLLLLLLQMTITVAFVSSALFLVSGVEEALQRGG